MRWFNYQTAQKVVFAQQPQQGYEFIYTQGRQTFQANSGFGDNGRKSWREKFRFCYIVVLYIERDRLPPSGKIIEY